MQMKIFVDIFMNYLDNKRRNYTYIIIDFEFSE